MKTAIEKLYISTFNHPPSGIEMISAHGSNRKYFRCRYKEESCIGVYNENVKENLAFINYAGQLRDKGINVPEILSFDLDKNVYLQQDLGDTTLYSYIQNKQEKDIKNIYKKVIEQLPKIQTVKGFDYTYAYPRKAFDMQSIRWDLNYFKYYFLKLSGIEFDEQLLEEDFNKLSQYLILGDCSYFLYRDFQSRNIMLVENNPYFIDFQGARQGALQYDIASLLYDAKADLGVDLRKELFEYYLDCLSGYITFDRQSFTDKYYAYIYIRIMQAMGAYGYRGYFQRKPHFLKSIPFALANLKYLEENVKLKIDLPYLHKLFSEMTQSSIFSSFKESKEKKLTVTIKSFSYKKGIPQDVSGNGGGFVFDCRALPNPGRIEELKQYTGLDCQIEQYFKDKPEMAYFLDNVRNLVNQSAENYLKRGFTHLSVYFGCTGGRHRSVYCAERLAETLSQNIDLNIVVNHIEQNL